MELIKRLELIIPSLSVKLLVEKMENLGVSNYSIVQHVTGKSDGDDKGGDMPVDILVSSMVIVYVSPDKLDALLHIILPFLNMYSGNCVVSDAWIIEKEKSFQQDI